MKKIRPADVKTDFDASLTALLAFYRTGLNAFPTDTDKSTFVESCLLTMAVTWEKFVHDLFIGYVNVDPAQFKQHLENALNEHLRAAAKPNKVFGEFASLSFPKHLTKKQVQDFADEEGFNITFKTCQMMIDKADAWLDANTATRFSALTLQQIAVIDAVIALRNHIAHRSERSGKTMNTKIGHGSLFPTGLQRQQNAVTNMGAWLKAKPVGKPNSRFAMFLAELKAIGAAL